MKNKANKPLKASQLELKEEVIAINRVTKVVKGGRNFRFTAIVVVGNGEGTIGYGIGKAKEVPMAVRKATESARKELIKIPIRGEQAKTIHHDTLGRYKAGEVLLLPATSGTGIKAGGATRVILKLAGIQNLLAKSKGSSNPHNLVKATFRALGQLSDPLMVARRRGVSLDKLFNG